MLNCFVGEGILINDPVKINSKQGDRFYAVFSLLIFPSTARKWIINQERENKKTGRIIIGAITEAGPRSEYALKALKRGDMISFRGALDYVKKDEPLLGVRIETLDKITSNCLRKDYRKTHPTIRSPQQSQSRQQYSEKTAKDGYGSYHAKQNYQVQQDKSILDDTEFNFEQEDES